MTPEQKARKLIDEQLEQTGWAVQSADEIDITANLGVAVREFSLESGFVDYLLYADAKVIGTFEAKSEGHALAGVVSQSAKCTARLRYDFRQKSKPLQRSDLDELIKCYNLQNCYRRRRTWNEKDRKRGLLSYYHGAIATRDKVNLGIFLLKDASPDNSDDLPVPDVLAQRIADNMLMGWSSFRQ